MYRRLSGRGDSKPGERIEVDPYLCQGGGSCTTVCPSGAIRYLYPNLRDNGKRLRDMLQCYLSRAVKTPLSCSTVRLTHRSLPAGLRQPAADGGRGARQRRHGHVPVGARLWRDAGGSVCRRRRCRRVRPATCENSSTGRRSWSLALGLERDCISICSADAALAEIESKQSVTAAEYDMPWRSAMRSFRRSIIWSRV